MIETNAFARDFVVKIIADGNSSLRLSDTRYRSGSQRLHAFFQHETLRAKNRKDSVRYGELIVLRNFLTPGRYGEFESFAAALRERAYWLCAAPNPASANIAFDISRPYAKSLFAELPEDRQIFIARAVEAFNEAVSP